MYFSWNQYVSLTINLPNVNELANSVSASGNFPVLKTYAFYSHINLDIILTYEYSVKTSTFPFCQENIILGNLINRTYSIKIQTLVQPWLGNHYEQMH